jgi:hypothetical protein
MMMKSATISVVSMVLIWCLPAMAGEPARLMGAKSVTEQRDVLFHALRSAGHACPVISDHMYGGEKGGMDFFSVRCKDGSGYMISIASAGEMQSRVMMCDVLAALEVHCFRPL